ncbi:alpha/beta hydrolase [Solimonas sp. K1W22B-7]|uniref:alpha/beta hydrolase n=1 Tax=Solimonas sp. K1W22B-7 TaxID=2303331 RepID=UPI0013C52F51|nr:alpha/beta hydrolase [Solimonas sp. K1W22B-7]
MQKLIPPVLRGTIKPAFNPRLPLGLRRRWLELTSRAMLAPRDCRYEATTLGGRPAERVRAHAQLNRSVILYLHGGGYFMGSPRTHRAITGRLARLTGATVYVPEYRLAPEHAYPAQLQDALAAYRALLDHGVAAECIAVAGDSAGGHLALSLLLALREIGLPQPAAAVLLSPWADAGLDGESVERIGARDPMLTPKWARLTGADFRGGVEADDPRVHLLAADLTGLPPLRIEVGSNEILLSDAEGLCEAAEAVGVEVSFRRWDGYWHVFQVHAGLLRAAAESLEGIAAWLRERWA